MKYNKQAFTLIELLVVVLIIGILAAIAVPQYQKAVFKSRMTEAFVNLKNLKNALDLCELENGKVTDANYSTNPCFQANNLNVSLGIASDNNFNTKNFLYVIGHNTGLSEKEEIAGMASDKKEGVCVCIHDDGHFSIGTDIPAIECSGRVPFFDVANTLNVPEDADCMCC